MNDNVKNHDSIDDNDYKLISKEDEKSSLELNDSDFGLTEHFEFENEEEKTKKKTIIAISIFVGVFIVAAVIAILVATSKDNYIDKLTVYSDGIVISDFSDVQRDSVDEFLKQKGYSNEEYVVDTTLTTVDVTKPIEGEEVTVYLLKKKNIQITYYNKSEDIDWVNREVEITNYKLPNVLDELGVVVSDNAIIYVDNNKVEDRSIVTVREGSEIRIVEDTVVEEFEEVEIDFTTEYIDDPNLVAGESRVQTEGVDGVKKITYRVTYSNGQEVHRETILTEVIKAPVNEVILRGTYTAPTNTGDNNSGDNNGGDE